MTVAIDLSAQSDKIQKMLIHTPYFDQVQRSLERALRDAGRAATPVCLHIVGHSRTGKSFAARDFEARFPAVRSAEGLRKQVVYVQAPPSGTIKGLMEALLQALGDPHWMRGTHASMLARLQTLLDAVGCRMIILDEFQHLVDKGQKAKLANATDWIKSLVECNTFSLVAVGLPSSTRIIYYNEQLRNRFDATIEMPVYDWTDRESRSLFRATLLSVQHAITPFQTPELASADMALRLFIASAGRIGLLAKILDRAVKDAVVDGRLEIRLQHLDAAYRTAVWSSTYLGLEDGPFFADLPEEDVRAVCARSMRLADQVPMEAADAMTNLGGLQPADAPDQRLTRKDHAVEMARALG